MHNQARKSLAGKKSTLQEDLFKRISEFEQDTGLSVTGISLARPDPAEATELRPEEVRIRIELVD